MKIKMVKLMLKSGKIDATILLLWLQLREKLFKILKLMKKWKWDKWTRGGTIKIDIFFQLEFSICLFL